MQPLPKPHRVDPLKRETDRNSGAGIPAVVQVIAVVDVGDIDVVVVVPIVAPVFRPRINGTYPIAAVLKARVSANNQEGETVDPESMLRPKVSAESVVRDAVAAVAATLLPRAVVGVPVLRAMLLPGTPLDTIPFLCAPWLFVASLLGVLWLPALVLQMLSLRVLFRLVLILPLLLLGVLWLPLPCLWLPLWLSMLLFRLGLFMLALLLLGLVLRFTLVVLFALLLMLCVDRSSHSEE